VRKEALLSPLTALYSKAFDRGIVQGLKIRRMSRSMAAR